MTGAAFVRIVMRFSLFGRVDAVPLLPKARSNAVVTKGLRSVGEAAL
jgi:hypothetical protein